MNKLPRKYKLYISVTIIGVLLLALLPIGCTCSCSPVEGPHTGDWNPILKIDAELSNGSHIYIMNSDGTGFSRIDDAFTSGAAAVTDFNILAIAADRSEIAFDQPMVVRSHAYYMPDWENVNLTRIVSGQTPTQGYVAEYWFSPDLSRVLFFEGDGSTSFTESLYIMESDGGSKARIGSYHIDHQIYIRPGWSPDGSKLAFVDYDNRNIYSFDFSNSIKTAIYSYSVDEYPPTLVWSPDSTYLYQIEDNGPSYDLYTINADGTGEQKIVENMARDTILISPDGSRIIYRVDSNFYIMNADGSGKSVLSDKNGVSSFQWSPDGTKISYLDNKGGLWVMNADGSHHVRLISSAFVKHFLWSPNSDKIFYQRGDGDIHVISTDETYFKKLTSYSDEDTEFVHSWTLSHDGQQLAYLLEEIESLALDDTVKMSLYVMDSDGTGVKKRFYSDIISFESNYPIIWSPDCGKLLFIVNKHPQGQEQG